MNKGKMMQAGVSRYSTIGLQILQILCCILSKLVWLPWEERPEMNNMPLPLSEKVEFSMRPSPMCTATNNWPIYWYVLINTAAKSSVAAGLGFCNSSFSVFFFLAGLGQGMPRASRRFVSAFNCFFRKRRCESGLRSSHFGRPHLTKLGPLGTKTAFEHVWKIMAPSSALRASQAVFACELLFNWVAEVWVRSQDY